MMKRILSALLVLCMLCALLPMGLSAVQAYSGTGVAYPVEGGNIYFDKETGTITGCDESVTTADIPAEIDGVAVTSIGWRAFSQCSNLTSVTISEGITSIDGWAFESCSSLTSITIPGSVTSIDDFAFAECSALMGIWVDESNLYYCSDEFGALYNKDRTTLLRVPVTISGEYAIADGVNSIGNQAFQHCSSMTSVTIPESVTSIGIQAFQHCSSMTSVTIPESVTSIEEDAFNDCSALTGIWVADSNLYYCNDESGILFNKDKTELLQTPEMISGQYTIPDGVLRLSDYAFYNCVHLTSVVIPDSVTSMGVFAFFHCISLKAACFKGDAPDIGDEETFVFLTYDEEGNPYDDIPGLTIYYIEGKAGWPWNRPTATWDGVNVPEPFVDEVTYPVEGGNLYFRKSTGEIYGCDASVTNAVIPAEIHGVAVTSIGDSAFGHCTGLTSITIPDSVTSIGNGAFSSCTGLSSIIVSVGNEVYDSRNNCDAIIETATNTLIAGCKNTTIPDSVTSIGAEAFGNCNRLASITIPDSVTSIGTRAFGNCTGLTSITIPDSVTSIGDSAFAYCTGLTSITIPDSVTSIGDCAFYDCTGLTSVYYTGSKEQWDQISISSYNSALTGATIYYNSSSSDNLLYLANITPNHTAVGADATFELRFNKNVEFGLGYIEVRDEKNQIVGQFTVSETVKSMSIDGKKVTIDISGWNLKDGAYSAAISKKAFKTPDGTYYCGMSDPMEWTFEVCSHYDADGVMEYAQTGILWWKHDDTTKPAIPNGTDSQYAQLLLQWAKKNGISNLTEQDVLRILDEPMYLPATDMNGATVLLDDKQMTVRQALEDVLFFESLKPFAEGIDDDLNDVVKYNQIEKANVNPIRMETDLYEKILGWYPQVDKYLNRRNECNPFYSSSAPFAYQGFLTAFEAAGGEAYSYTKPLLKATLDTSIAQSSYTGLSQYAQYSDFKNATSELGFLIKTLKTEGEAA